ncbi:MAG: hypothetical protein IJU91_07015 [Selenomonadaceae bacterium]|nr:hypothetical protein [Selenomonadaceae bacterium]
MDKPTLTIDGKKIEMLEPKARFWRQGLKLSEQRKDLPAIDYVDAHCEFIAQVFGVSVDEVLDNIDVIDVMPLFYDIVAYIMSRLWLKLTDKKKAEVTDAEKA